MSNYRILQEARYPMRKPHLFLGTALGLTLGVAATALSAPPALAQSVSTSSSGDQNLTATVTQTSGTAVTVDSNNNVTVSGIVNMAASSDNSTAILVNGGHVSTTNVSGTLTASDNYTATDTTSANGKPDTVIDTPWAQGAGRYAVHTIGTAPVTGGMVFTNTSVLDVEGNSSFGIRLEAPLIGNFDHLGSLTLIGDNSQAISIEGPVTGQVRIGGVLSSTGQNTTALNLAGNVSGPAIIDASITGTGYSNTTGALTTTQVANLTAGNLLQDGALVKVSGNLAGGLLLNVTPTASTTNTDVDGDGIADSTEGTANLTQLGGAPALLIGSATQDITLNRINVAATATAPWPVAYGLVMRGNINASGLYTGVGSTAVQIGGMGHNVTLENGMLLTGAINTKSLNGDTTAVSLLSGAIAPTFEIAGPISSAGTTTYGNSQNTNGLYLGQGANLASLLIDATGSVTATATGTTGHATAVFDGSNSLGTITVNGPITASIIATDQNGDGAIDIPTWRPIAIDLSGNTIGGRVGVTGAAVTGDIYFGSGANTLTLTSPGAVVATATGRVTSAGPIAVDVASGKLLLSDGSHLNTTTLHVGATSTLGVTLDVSNPSSPVFVGSGAAVFDNGATLNLGLNRVLLSPTHFTILTASSLSVGTLTTNLNDQAPYLFVASLTSNSTSLMADFRLKTAAESTLSSSEYAALVPILTAVQGDSGATVALVSPTTKAGFLKVYDQFLPDFSGETLLTLAKGNESINQGLAQQTRLPEDGATQFWVQEDNEVLRRKSGDTAGFSAIGFSLAAGAEKLVGDSQALGVYTDMTTNSPHESNSAPNQSLSTFDVSAGAYWRLYAGPAKAWLRAGVGYAKFDSKRQVFGAGVDHTASSTWNGISLSGSAGASARYSMGWLNLTPEASANYYNLSEAAHTETGGGNSYDLSVAKRDNHLLSARAIVTADFGEQGEQMTPAVWAGYQDNVSVNMADTVAHFTGGSQFAMSSQLKPGGGPIAGARLSIDNAYSYFAVEASYEKQRAYDNLGLSLRARFLF